MYAVIELDDWGDEDTGDDLHPLRVFAPFDSVEIATQWAQTNLSAGPNSFTPYEVQQFHAPEALDNSSSASRQHYIDTGHYLLLGEAETV